MDDLPRFDDLIEELRLVLADVHQDPTPTTFVGLGETVGTLCAAADRNSLGRAVTEVQRSLAGSEHPGTRAAMLTSRASLASAGSTKAALQSQSAETRLGGTVRERVLAFLKERPGVRTSELAGQLELSVPQASRALHELAKSGSAVVEVPDGDDKRVRIWSPSPGVLREVAPYACVSDALTGVVPSLGSFRNDMLPLGPADRAEPASVANMSERLSASLSTGRYKPVRATQFRVAKDGNTSRPAALLRLPDRLVYSALAQRACDHLEERLSDAVLWPRAQTRKARWAEFEQSPLESDSSFVVVADVASFYDSVDHALLRDTLIEHGSSPEVTETLTSFLGTVMGRTVGLPQGLPASDPLASFALSPVDEGLRSAGIQHFRHGDDFRIVAKTRYEAREAIALLGDLLRGQRLHLSTSKTMPVPTEQYSENVDERKTLLDKALSPIRVAMGFETDQGIVGTGEGFDPEADPGLDDLGRLADLSPDIAELLGIAPPDAGLRMQLGRYGELEDIWMEEPDCWPSQPSEAVEQLLNVAESNLTEAARRLRSHRVDPWEAKLHRDVFSTSLSLLSLFCRPACDSGWWTSFLQDRPQDTWLVARYLTHLAYRGAAELPVEVAQGVLTGEFSDWQAAWAVAAAAAAEDRAESLVPTLAGHMDTAGWLTRLASANLLQQLDVLTSTQLYGLWADAPVALRPDLAILLARAEQTADVARALHEEADEVERVLAMALVS